MIAPTNTTCSTAQAYLTGASWRRSNLTVGYTGKQGQGHVHARCVEHARARCHRGSGQVPSYGEVDYKTSGCLDGAVINGNAINGCGRATYNALQLSATRRFRSGVDRRGGEPVFDEQRHDAGLERGSDGAEHLRLRNRIRDEPAGHSSHVQWLGCLPGSG